MNMLYEAKQNQKASMLEVTEMVSDCMQTLRC